MSPSAAATAPPPAPRRRLARRVWRLVDQASIYLPMLLMGLLALGSYWLVRVTPEPPEPGITPEVGSDPDHAMRRFSVRLFNADGSLRAEIVGDEARHYPDTGIMEIDIGRVRSFSPTRQLTEAGARRITSNADKTEFVLQGDAVVVRHGERDASGAELSQTLEFRGEFLQVRTEEETVFSDQPVTLIRGTDRLSGNRLLYQGAQRTLELTGRVRAEMPGRRP